MIQKKLIDYIQRNPEKMAEKWMERVRKSEYMKRYNALIDEDLNVRGMRLFEHLAKWLDGSISRTEIGRYFVAAAKKRFEEKFPLCELGYALYLEKKVFWEFIQSEGALSNPLQMYQAMDLIISISDFFDLGNFFVARGYMAAMYVAMQKSEKFKKSEIDKFFYAGSFLKEDTEFDESLSYFPFFDSRDKPDLF